MADEKPVPSPAKVKGVDIPFEPGKHPLEGVDEDTLFFHGVHPETKERMAVTIEGLQAEFGPELGEKKYVQIAGIGGGSQFFNPHMEATNYRPPLGIGDLTGKFKTQVAAILAAKE